LAYEAGTAYLSILPSMAGAPGRIADQMAGPLRRAGQQGGAQFGDGINDGIGQGQGRRGFAAAGAKAGGFFVAAFAAVGVAEIGRSVMGYLSESIDAAATMGETQSKLAQIFGDSSRIIEDYAKDTSRNILLTRQAAMDAAGTFGIFARSAGLAGDDAANFSVELATLAGDLASFNNTSPEQAIQAIGAALRGESEPIRQYGVLLDDATLKQRALNLGIYDGTGVLSQQQRVMAAHAEILAQTTTQQGDAARTADSFANRQRQLEKAIEDTKVEIGTALLPVVNQLMGVFLETGIPILQDLAKWFEENQEEITSFALRMVDLGITFGGILLTMARMGAEWQGAMLTVTTRVVTFWLDLAEKVLGAATTAFGWIPGVGERLRGAQTEFRTFRDTAERQLAAAKAGSDSLTTSLRAGESAVGELSSSVRGLDGFTANVNIKLNLPRYSESQIPGTPAWYASRGIPVPGRAHGGPVVAGRPYLVGERGPELIVPRTSGTVLTNAQTKQALGGSTTINVVADPRYAERQAELIVTRMRDMNTRFLQ
jgi:hypothetical protein